jgi:hypothetical protein
LGGAFCEPRGAKSIPNREQAFISETNKKMFGLVKHFYFLDPSLLRDSTNFKALMRNKA